MITSFAVVIFILTQSTLQLQQAINAANMRLEEIEEELIPLREQYEAKQQEADAMNINDSNLFSEYSGLERKASNIYTKLQIWKTNNPQ